jgi:two-component system cell cycle response regulator
VDDSATPRLVLKRELEAMGHECLVAEDGVEGWEALQDTVVDVVISDWMMPRMDGDELCRRVRSDRHAPYAYFILHTSLEDRGHIVQGMEAGADDYLTKPVDNDELTTRLIAAARVTALHHRLASQQTELERLNGMLFEDSRRDRLTGLGNRRRMDEDLERLTQRAARHGSRFSVALFDVDRFKQFNDTAGHAAGDAVLASVAGELTRLCRSEDVAYRYGGEELLVAFADEDLEAATVAAERVRASIEALGIAHPGVAAGGVVTVSGGVACLEPGEALGTLLERADAALYEAKEAGRNRIMAERTGSLT